MDRELWIKYLKEFVVEGHKNGWAAGNEAPSLIPGTNRAVYTRGPWKYEDTYSGFFRAPGSTIVSMNGKPVWFMSYFGEGQIEKHEGIVEPTFKFLKHSLVQVTTEMPFRGPSPYFRDNENFKGWEYRFRLVRGDIQDFLGHESINFRGTQVFRQTVGGGIIIGKDDSSGTPKPVYPWAIS